VLRATLRDEFRAAAIKRAETGLRVATWKNGKQGEYSTVYL
jgi:ATP synthase epsilon subunit